METCNKAELIQAFKKRNSKRRDLLFNYYQSWFGIPYTAETLSQKIEADLGIHVGVSIIYHIRSKHKPGYTKAGQDKIPRSTGKSDRPVSELADEVPDLDQFAQKAPLVQFL